MRFLAWSVRLLVAGLLGLGIYWALGPRPERSHLAVVQVDVPAGWKSLPIVAHATSERVEEHEDAIDHSDRLGPFLVHWSYVRYQDKPQFIGPFGWTVTHPDFRSHVESGSTQCLSPPNALRQDPAGETWVLGGQDGGACVAFRKARVVDAMAYEGSPSVRIGVAALVATIVLLASATMYRRG